jgi:hypothetical protein
MVLQHTLNPNSTRLKYGGYIVQRPVDSRCRNREAISANNIDYDYVPLLMIAGCKNTGTRINRTNIAIASIATFSPANPSLELLAQGMSNIDGRTGEDRRSLFACLSAFIQGNDVIFLHSLCLPKQHHRALRSSSVSKIRLLSEQIRALR